ncbi:MAG: hypothetical protein IIU36_00960 [Firmicutes bacterium]|nr:hypothetical protein [Bacillota bacterium]
MKKSLRIIIPLLILVLALILTTTMASAATSIPVRHMATSDTDKPAYSSFLPAGYSDINYYAFTATATGKAWFDIAAQSSNTGKVAAVMGKTKDEIYAYFSENTANSTIPAIVDPSGTKTSVGGLDVEKGKTYYIGLFGEYENLNVKLKTYIYAYSSRLLKPQSSFLLSSVVTGKSWDYSTIKYKIVPPKTGVMTVTLKAYNASFSQGDVKLLRDGKAFSAKLTYNSDKSFYKVHFGVKKGKTYYLKVSDIYVDPNTTAIKGFKYGIKYSIKGVTQRNISKKSKAKTLKRKATATSTLFVANGSTENDWYKFTVTSKRKTQFKINAEMMTKGSDDKLTITAYKGSNKIGTATLPAGYSDTFTITYGTTTGKASKGTYYIKVHRNSKLSGKYTIKYST